MQTVYAVRNGNSGSIIAYAMGEEKDILEFYKDKLEYVIWLDPIKVVHVTTSLVEQKTKLLQEKEKYTKLIFEIEDKLDEISTS